MPTDVTVIVTLLHSSETASESMIFNEDSQTDANFDIESKAEVRHRQITWFDEVWRKSKIIHTHNRL